MDMMDIQVNNPVDAPLRTPTSNTHHLCELVIAYTTRGEELSLDNHFLASMDILNIIKVYDYSVIILDTRGRVQGGEWRRSNRSGLILLIQNQTCQDRVKGDHG